MSSLTKVLYIGMTNDLIRRIHEHKNKMIQGFSQKYKTKNLVYYEAANSPEVAIAREKQLKRWRREKKEALINRMNPSWHDLYENITG